MQPLITWFADHGRPLPWRTTPRDPWATLVSEVMLQQTQVARVVPRWQEWLSRWPTAADLAAAPVADVLTAWDRLGYPRRALRLHQAATAISERHNGQIPDDHAELVALPGIGDYSASAVLAFAYRRRVAVIDTNVRRVLARSWDGLAAAAGGSATKPERARLVAALPVDAEAAAQASEALMELGALRCSPAAPDCPACPLAGQCAWRAAGHPTAAPVRRRQPAFAGSDRQARGVILAAVRSDGVVSAAGLDALWPNPRQAERAVTSLVADGLLTATRAGWTFAD